MRKSKKALAMMALLTAAMSVSACGKKAEETKAAEVQTAQEAGAEMMENEAAAAVDSVDSEADTTEGESEAPAEPVELPEAGEVVQSGAFGEGTYTLDDKGIMTLSGSGKLMEQESPELPDKELVKYLVVEEGVTSVGGIASNFPDILYASLPSTLRYIRFLDCEKLSTVIISEGITEFENDAFSGCKSLTSLTLPESVRRLGMRAFGGSGLKTIEMPERMSYIDNAFCNTPLETIIWPAGVDTIYPGTFYQCTDLISITLPRDVTDIRDNAFLECGLKDVYYQGTEAEFKAIKIGNGNEPLLNAEIHYNAE